MKLLLDTHAFIWSTNAPERLPSRVREACRDGTNELILSVANIHEMEIKIGLGKMQIDMPLEELVRLHQVENRVQVLPVQAAHVYALRGLPPIHRDPFDRLLVAQANVEDASLVSGDDVIARYPVRVFW